MKFGVVILALSATAMAYESLTPRDEGLAPRDDQCKVKIAPLPPCHSKFY